MKKLLSTLMAVMCLSAKAQVNYVATTNALALRVPSPNNPVVIVAPADGSTWKLWRYSPSSTSTDWDNALVTTTGVGRWLNVPLTDPVLTGGGGGGSGTVTSITLTQPAAGLTISSSGTAITTSGTRTFTLANDLAALEALSGTGYPSRTGTDTWSISTTVPWSAISSTPTTLAGYGLTVEGTDIKSTGEVGGSKFLREDGDGTSSWQAIPGGGDALTSSNLDQFANVTQTGTLAITGPATLSGSNTGDQDLSSYATTSAVAAGYQPLDSDLTELAANQGIIRTNGIWWGTMTGENIISDLITTAAGILPYTGETEPDNYFAPIIFVKNLSPAIADTVTDLLAVDIMGIPRWGYVLTGTYTGTWVYCPDVTDADNGTTIRRPDEIASDATPGRWEYMGPATGDVVGPSSATDNAIARFDGTTGKLIQNSAATIADTTGDITAGKYNTVAISGSATPTLAVSGTTSVSGANTGDETAAGLLAKIITVDGAGSGLDADTLDGSSSAAFAAASHTHAAADITSGTIDPARLGSGSGGSSKFLREDSTFQTIPGGGDALTSSSLDQFADVTQTAGQTLAITSSTTLSGGTHSGTNTGDQTSVTGNSGTVTFADAGGDTTTFVALGTAATGSLAPATDAGLTYNATADALTAATFIGSLTGNASTATTLATTRAIYGNNFDGSAALTQIIASTYGGTGNGFTKFSGPTATEKTFTLPDANATLARTDAANTFTGASTANAWVLTSPTITTGIVPTSNDGAAIGSTANQFSDLFLSEGGVINFDNGDATLTQAGDVVTLAGADLKITTPGTAATSVATIDGTQTLTGKTIDADDNVFADIPVEIGLAASDETTAITAATGKLTFRAPYAFTLTAVRSSVTTAPTGATILIDINETGTTVLSTKLMIDTTEKTSTTATTAYVISDSAIADDAEITIDFDQVGSTVAGAGVKIWLIGKRSY